VGTGQVRRYIANVQRKTTTVSAEGRGAKESGEGRTRATFVIIL